MHLPCAAASAAKGVGTLAVVGAVHAAGRDRAEALAADLAAALQLRAVHRATKRILHQNDCGCNDVVCSTKRRGIDSVTHERLYPNDQNDPTWNCTLR